MKADRTQPYQAVTVGYLAYQAVSEERSARVVGSTSRGIFLLTPKKRILFITGETYRSPLTINVFELSGKFDAVIPGMPAEISPIQVEIPEASFSLSVADHIPWYPPDPVEISRQPTSVRHFLEEMVQEITNAQDSQGFSFLLAPLLYHQEPEFLDPKEAMVMASVKRLKKTLIKQDPGETVEVFKSLMGLGRGLTPSGDDLIMGLLATVNRWPQACRWVSGMASINQLAIQTAYLTTTAISANLIECATCGHTDERLLIALDGIVTGSIPPFTCVENLFAFGASSGIDALAGIIVALHH